jgi:adenosylmethionine-8-amino-7-oxononanoate aminotransferase
MRKKTVRERKERMNVKQADRKFLFRDTPAQDLQIVKSEDSLLYDERGRKYIDFLMGWCVGNLGWGNKIIRARLGKLGRPDYVNPFYLYKPWAELAELLAEITPGRLMKSFRATGGTEAVEVALRAAMSATGRSKFISIEDSYHGNSIGAMSVGTSYFREQYVNLLPGCYKIMPPLNGNAADRAEKLLKRRDIAAFIMEPVICNLGVLMPEKEFMSGMQQLCRKYGTLLIMDEVATGFGRTGKLFASEHFGMKPDIMCMAKGITGGYAGLGATIITEKVARSIQDGFFYYSTYGWHPLGVEAAVANIRYIVTNKDKLLANVTGMGDYFRTRLSRMKFKYPAAVRVVGLAVGVDTGNDDYALKVLNKCQAKGLLFSVDGQTLIMFPALNIDKKTAKKGLDILEQCL